LKVKLIRTQIQRTACKSNACYLISVCLKSNTKLLLFKLEKNFGLSTTIL